MRLNYKTIAYALVTLLLLAGLIVLAARHDKAKVTSEVKKPATSQKAPAAKAPATAKPQPQPAAPVSPSQSATADNLPNNGPGDVAALFGAAVAASTLGYHLLQRKRI